MYQILNWDKFFENDRSRQRDRCSFVCIPNKLGMGLNKILSLDNGASIFGIFVLMIEACSRQPRPRSGFLSDDGTEGGRAWTIDDMAALWRRKSIEIEAVLKILTSAEIGWIKNNGLSHDNSVVTTESPSNHINTPPTHLERTNERTERTEGKGRERTNTGAEPPGSPSAVFKNSNQKNPIVLTIADSEGGKNNITLSFWQQVLRECDDDVNAAALVFYRAHRKARKGGIPGWICKGLSPPDQYALSSIEDEVSDKRNINDWIETNIYKVLYPEGK